jgi:hypothetical protein
MRLLRRFFVLPTVQTTNVRGGQLPVSQEVAEAAASLARPMFKAAQSQHPCGWQPVLISLI